MKWKDIPFKEGRIMPIETFFDVEGSHLHSLTHPLTPVTASDEVYKTIIEPQTGVAFMPTLLIVHQSADGSSRWETVQDTKDIIDYFERTFPPPPHNELALDHAVVPGTPKRAFATMMFEMLSDEWVAIQGMFWRWGDGEWERERFEQQMGFLEFEFGNTNTGGRRGLSISEIQEIGRDASLTYPMAVYALLLKLVRLRPSSAKWALPILASRLRRGRSSEPTLNPYSHCCRRISSVILSCSDPPSRSRTLRSWGLSMLISQEIRYPRS